MSVFFFCGTYTDVDLIGSPYDDTCTQEPSCCTEANVLVCSFPCFFLRQLVWLICYLCWVLV